MCTVVQVGTWDPSNPASLEHMVQIIAEEMDDQTDPAGPPARVPLAAVRSMMERGWIWTCKSRRVLVGLLASDTLVKFRPDTQGNCEYWNVLLQKWYGNNKTWL